MKIVGSRAYFFGCFLLISSLAKSQNVTGIWRGHFRSNEAYERLMGIDDRYKMEVQIAQTGKNFDAVTYSYKSTVFYGKAEADGWVDPGAHKVLLRELKIVELRMVAGSACIMTCYLQYSKLGDEEFLEGTYTSKNVRDTSNCGKGIIFLHKVPETDFYKEPFLEKKEKQTEGSARKSAPEKKETTDTAATHVNPKPNIAATKPPAKKPVASTKKPVVKKPAASSTVKNPPVAQNKTSTPAKPVAKPPVKATPKPVPITKDLAKSDPNKHSLAPMEKDTIASIEKKAMPVVVVPKVLATRSNEVVKSIAVNTPDVELNIYDDGTIDNDTVSVYYDKKLILSNARLTDQAIVVKIHVEEGGEHELVMVAENLGDIPPNTSLMVVKAGEKRYEVRIVSTEQKNAVVLFKYEKPQ
ncbi:MAG: hypothetical protein C5B59_18840 [Bacteroidetes bacterium]|nr:MAG: hypothetical protein C5B59_18840 [Bacteroidota bacterium]